MNAPQIHSLLVEFRASRDPEVLASLFDATASELLEVASRIVRDDALAEDVLQNTFVAVIESIDRFDPNQEPQSGPGWLVGIVGNQARYRLRQAKRSIDPRRVEAPSTVEPGRSVVVEESSDAVRAAVRTLPDVHRSVVELVLAGVGSPKEIARRLGRSAGAVRVQLHRGIGMLRATLPPGVALGAAFAILEQESLAATRATVVARACAGQKSAVTAGTGVVLKLGSLVVAGGLIAGAISLRSESVEPPHAPAGVEAASAASLVVVDESDPILPDVASAGSTIAIVAGSESTREAVGEPASAETFDFVVTGTVGIDLANARLVAPEDGDVVVNEDYRAQKQTGLGGMDDRNRSGDLAALSRPRLLAAIVDVDPRRRPFALGSRVSAREAALIVARLGDGSIFALSTVDMRRTAKGTSSRILGRRVPAATFDPAPFDPVAARETRTVQDNGLRFDLTAAANDPIGAEIEARNQSFRDEIDHEAALLDARGLVPPEWKVRGCALRDAASTVSMIRYFDYIVSTYSFVHDTRDDVGSTCNDWEVEFRGSERPVVNVFMVTDDRSKVFDLGNLDPSASISELVAAAGAGFEQMPISAETTYLIRTLDTETDRLDLVRILAIRDSRFVIFGWKPIEDSVAREEILAAIAAPLPKIENGTVRIQLRGGACGGNPNQVFIDGSKNVYVREVVASPLDLDGEIDIQEPHRAWVDGGLIPRGKSWRVRRIDYSASTVGDSNGPGGFRIELGGVEVVNAETSNFATTGTWTGEIVLKPGDEVNSFVEIRNSSQCDVTITGEMIDAPGGG